MMNESVYYINIKPYIHDLSFEEMNNRFLKSNLGKTLVAKEKKDCFINFIQQNSSQYNFIATKKDQDDYKIDIILSKRILYHLHDFFSNIQVSYKNKTRKKQSYHKIKNKSMKHSIYTN
jgi:hypothetical protein